MLHQLIFWALFWVACGAGLGGLVAGYVGAAVGALVIVAGIALLAWWVSKFAVVG